MEALSNEILKGITTAYFICWVLYLCNAVLKRRFFGVAATALTVLTWLAHTAAIILRWVASHQMGIGHAPFSNLFESLVFFGWTLTLIYLIVQWRTKNLTIGAFAMPLSFLSVLLATNPAVFSLLLGGSPQSVDPAIKPLQPALKSNWLIAHVIACFLGYAGFGVSAALGVMYLTTKQQNHPDSPRALTLDMLIYQTVVIGFILLTVGIVTGAVWAEVAWGRYWGWDSKETWSLITWLVYAGFLHSRYLAGWHGRRLAIFSIVGFACVLFTFFGVNLLLAGLHSYAR